MSLQRRWTELFPLKNTGCTPPPALNYSHRNICLSVAVLHRTFRGQGHVLLKNISDGRKVTVSTRAAVFWYLKLVKWAVYVWINLTLIVCDLYCSYAVKTGTKCTEADHYSYDHGPHTWWVYVWVFELVCLCWSIVYKHMHVYVYVSKTPYVCIFATVPLFQ